MGSTADETAAGTPGAERPAARRPLWSAFLVGAGVGLLGGVVGLGGAEFRLPFLIGLFGFVALQAVIVNKAMSLLVVLVALPSRLVAVPLEEVASYWFVAVSLLLGSLPGAWMGASWATRMRAATLYRVLGVLLLGIAVVFAAHHLDVLPELLLPTAAQALVGAVAGFGIGVVAAVMGVAGGELLIPTITVLYAVNVKYAGSLSLLVCADHAGGVFPLQPRRGVRCASAARRFRRGDGRGFGGGVSRWWPSPRRRAYGGHRAPRCRAAAGVRREGLAARIAVSGVIPARSQRGRSPIRHNESRHRKCKTCDGS